MSIIILFIIISWIIKMQTWLSGSRFQEQLKIVKAVINNLCPWLFIHYSIACPNQQFGDKSFILFFPCSIAKFPYCNGKKRKECYCHSHFEISIAHKREWRKFILAKTISGRIMLFCIQNIYLGKIINIFSKKNLAIKWQRHLSNKQLS